MAKKTIVIITDAWYPQVNGVVTTYENIIKELPSEYQVRVISPDMFTNFKNPLYKEISISLCTKNKMRKILKQIVKENDICYFHLATEGVLGFQAKRVLEEAGTLYTTAYHTKFPEFIKALYGIPTCFTRWYFDWFHRNSKCVMMSSKSVASQYPRWNCKVLQKGYDSHFTFSSPKNHTPILLYVGRVSKEKGVEDFCKIHPLRDVVKIVVGDGPIKKKLRKKYPDVHFVGYKFGKELAEYYQNADVLVFPSRNDTYGIVILEAMACGTPVAAYPVDGAKDQIKYCCNGDMDNNLTLAAMRCLTLSRLDTASSVYSITWKNSANQFIKYIEG
jgi:glycosyltransferase involved in cell wall biosynthesis